MILAYQSTHLGRTIHEFCCTTVNHLLGCECRLGELGYGVDTSRNDALAQSATLYKPPYVGTNGVVWEEVSLVYHSHNMIAVWRKEWLRYLALVQSECLLLEFLYCLSSLYPRQVASSHARTFIVGHPARHVGKVSPTNQGLIYRICLKRCGTLLLGISLLR